MTAEVTEKQVIPNGLKRIRENEDLSQAELAQLAGRSADTIADIENLKRLPSARTKKQIVRALNDNPKRRDKSVTYSDSDVFPLAPLSEN